jgi:hypothetical protein
MVSTADQLKEKIILKLSVQELMAKESKTELANNAREILELAFDIENPSLSLFSFLFVSPVLGESALIRIGPLLLMTSYEELLQK